MSATLTQRNNETCCETPTRTRTYRPQADIYESGDGWVVTVDLPGVDESGVDLALEQGVLTIRAESKLIDPEGLDSRYTEFAARDFHRSFRIPDDVDGSRIEAEVKHGVLTLRLPKAPEAQPQKITVKAG